MSAGQEHGFSGQIHYDKVIGYREKYSGQINIIKNKQI